MRRITRKYMFLRLVMSAVVGMSLVGMGCSHTPARPAELDQARISYGEVQANPQVASRAPVALREAEEALLRAEQLWDKDKDIKEVQNLAAVAQRRVEIARATAEQKQGEAELEEIAAARERLLLEARTREAQRAQEQAERAQREADQAYQQVRAATTQTVQLERELTTVREEVAAKEAATKAQAKTCRNSRGVAYPCRTKTR